MHDRYNTTRHDTTRDNEVGINIDKYYFNCEKKKLFDNTKSTFPCPFPFYLRLELGMLRKFAVASFTAFHMSSSPLLILASYHFSNPHRNTLVKSA